METQPILFPGVAMVALTFVVMMVMYRRRVAQMRRERIHPQAVATSTLATTRLTDCAAADNFRNLFELPVLFYFALVTAALSGQTGATVQALAWAFVVLRAAHSAIHCGYNKVMHRFRVYVLGAGVLLALWLRLAWGMVAA